MYLRLLDTLFTCNVKPELVLVILDFTWSSKRVCLLLGATATTSPATASSLGFTLSLAPCHVYLFHSSSPTIERRASTPARRDCAIRTSGLPNINPVNL